MEKFKKRLLSFLERGESIQLIAPPGFGKSRIARSLGGLLLDTNLLQTPDELLAVVRASSERKLIVIDYLDHILTESYKSFFGYLRGLRDAHKYSLGFVFVTSTPLGAQFRPLLGELFEIATEHIEHVPPLEVSEYDTFGFTPTPKQLKEIERLSGGIPALVKICMFAMRDETSLNPEQNPKLKGQIEEMLVISADHPTYRKSAIMQTYLTTAPGELTAAETRLLDLLLTNRGKIVSKNQICDSVYPDVKNKAGISDHSLDQLLHRLRNKVQDKYTITTHRGLGYKLS